ncbi:pyrroline-5-carboxylate reductase isoform X3 [Ziziphus jujuba]|uniref:Pyrroline-5-carboxylate reductase n=1 Tax=Ziziphus jujuba TaxID=326968 RepID=A0ABM3ZX02_ZIZJJ|nr:pyrroline-5-carboxylate reductase isoform X3 [Ziziphus jujuba]
MEVLTIPTDTYKLGFIGAGKMAESIARGVVQSGVLPASRIRTSHSNPARRKVFESFGVQLLPRNHDEWAGNNRFIRVMPNTPAAVGEAASVMSLGAAATEEDGDLIAKLFGSVGKIWKADDKLFDAITGLSGSGPAYIYLAIEALADGGVAAGLPRELALGLASQTVLGAATMASKTGKHPGQLKDDVTSPGGTTISGIHELEKGGFRGVLMNAVVAAARRSRELSS